jgi:Fe-S-cluster-containing dehydrogenase component
MASNSLSRRAFLRSALGAGAAITVGGIALGLDRSKASTPGWQEAAARYALVIDTTKCTGCGACRTVCQLKNNLPGESSYIHILSQGDPSNPTFLPVQCQHCAEPPCARVCPARATYHDESGVVLIQEKKCVGCKYCELACPYQARVFDEERGVADKCWLCLDLVEQGQDPACVQACKLGARSFGRQDDAGSEVARLIAEGVAKPFHPEFGTQPSIVYYIA